MGVTELIVVRHGLREDEINPWWRTSPDGLKRCYDPPLHATGRDQCVQLARSLVAHSIFPDCILTSPFQRCVQSACMSSRALSKLRPSTGANDDEISSDTNQIVPVYMVTSIGEVLREASFDSCGQPRFGNDVIGELYQRFSPIMQSFDGDQVISLPVRDAVFPETIAEARERFANAFAAIAKLMESKVVLVLTHGDAVAHATTMDNSSSFESVGRVVHCSYVRLQVSKADDDDALKWKVAYMSEGIEFTQCDQEEQISDSPTET